MQHKSKPGLDLELHGMEAVLLSLSSVVWMPSDCDNILILAEKYLSPHRQ